MITQQYKLNLIPTGKDPVIVRCSQYDKDSRSIEFSLFNNGEPFALNEGYVVTVRGTKKDGTAFEYECSIVNNNAVFQINQQMTLFDGKYPCELRIVLGDEILGSMNFTLLVEKSPINEDTVISESDLPAYEQLLSDMQSNKITIWLEENIAQETGYVLDTSLTVQGAAADAKAVGDKVSELQALIESSGSSAGLTPEISNALLACFRNVAWINTSGQDYYNSLEEAIANAGGTQYTITNLLTECINSNSRIKIKEGRPYSATLTANSGYALDTVTVTMGGIDVTGTYYSGGTISIPNVTGDIVITAVAASVVSSISAVYTQGGTVYDTASLDSLKDDLVVTATYDDTSTATVPSADYTLSGTLTAGTSTITITYGGKTTTFTVTVTANPLPSGYTMIQYVERPASAGLYGYNSTGVSPNGTDDLEVYAEFMLTEAPESSSGGYIVIAHQASGNNTVGFGLYVKQDMTQIGVYAGSSALISPNGGSSVKDIKYSLTATRTTTSVSISDGTNSDTVSLSPRTMNGAMTAFAMQKYNSQEATLPVIGRMYRLIVTEGNTVKANWYPAIRNSDNAIGFYDTAQSTFRTSTKYVAGPEV